MERASDKAGADMRYVESHINTFMEAAPDAVRWHYSAEGWQNDIVAAQMDLGILTTGREVKLSIARWLDREAYANGPYGYGIRDLEHGPMLRWSAGAETVDDIQAVKPQNFKPAARHDLATRLAALAHVLPYGTPTEDDILAEPQDSIHRRPPLLQRIMTAHDYLLSADIRHVGTDTEPFDD